MAGQEPPTDEAEPTVVSIDKIGTTPLKSVPEEEPVSGQNPLTGTYEFPHELGYIGKFIGGRSEKAGNLAFFVIAICFLLLVILAVGWVMHSSDQGEFQASGMFAPLIGLVGTAIGYVFGKGPKKDD